MNNDTILEMAKADLQILNDSFNAYLMQLIEVAKAEITREGITLKDTIDDMQTIEMYVAYLYRKRTDSNNGMPRMLRYRLNNRLFAEKQGMSI